jgi:LysM repeat protein
MLLILREGKEIQPKVIFEPERASRTLTSWSEILHRDPVDAWIQLSGAEVEVHPAKTGLQLDANHTLKELSENHKPIYLEYGWLPLYTNQTQAQRVDVDQAVANLDDLLSSPVATHAYDPVTDERFTWQADKELVASWISLEDLGDQIEIEINTQFIQEYVDDLNSSLGSERYIEKDQVVDKILSDLTGSAEESVLHIVSYYPGEYIVRPGDTLVSIGFELQMPYWKLLELNPMLSTHGLSSGQILRVPPRDDLLTLPVIPEKRIVISIREQRMRVYEHGELKWVNIVSTGIPDSPTLPGIFQISSHYENAYASIWDLYMPHFMGIYDAVPGLTNGIHGLPVLSNGQRLWTNVLGSPASYGCIILDLEAAEELFYWAEEGIVVEIQA